jgi:hypothetical protein
MKIKKLHAVCVARVEEIIVAAECIIETWNNRKVYKVLKFNYIYSADNMS